MPFLCFRLSAGCDWISVLASDGLRGIICIARYRLGDQMMKRKPMKPINAWVVINKLDGTLGCQTIFPSRPQRAQVWSTERAVPVEIRERPKSSKGLLTLKQAHASAMKVLAATERGLRRDRKGR